MSKYPYTVSVPGVRNEVLERLENNFTYHKPHGDQPARYEQLRAAAKTLAQQIVLQTPESREQSVALTNLEQVVFWANAAIARNEKEPATEQAA